MEMQLTFFADLEEEVDEDDELELCSYAKQFREWANSLRARKSRNTVDINQAKVLLLDKYYEWRNSVPSQHRTLTSDRGHYCIFHVFDAAYKSLRLAELSLTPPMLFIPPPPLPPPQPKPPEIMGVTFGEVVEE